MSELGVNSSAAEGRGVEIGVLGPIEARVDEAPVVLGGPRQKALLGLLTLRLGRTAPADELIDALWSGEPPDGASTTLRSYVSRLRAAFGDAVQITADASGYALHSDPTAVDSIRFEESVRNGDQQLRNGNVGDAAAAFAQALAAWRGRPFGDLADDGPLRVEADRLEEVRLHALEQRLEAEIGLGHSAEIADEAEALTRMYPYRERLWRLLMLVLYHSGRQADALAAYQRARANLDEQLGIEPGPELQGLEVAILRQEVPAVGTATRRDQLPPDLTAFVGRESELEQLASLLKETRLVTLTGVGGVGKTRLATELARQSVDLAKGGRVFVDLATVSHNDPDGVARATAHALAIREQAPTALANQIASELGHSTVLIVLDNCEHVIDGAASLADALLASCPGLRIVVTSRAPLGVRGEVEHRVVPMTLPPNDATVEEIHASEAVRLLIERSYGGPRVDVDAAEMAAAARICRDLDGLPLAIELAAARTKVLSLPEIAGRLDDRFRFLVSWRRVTSARHQTLRQAMDWSYELLEPPERALLERISAFTGGFTLEAAAAVGRGAGKGDGDGDGDHDALDGVTRLVDASLLAAERSGTATRYRLLETVREYAAARLTESGAFEQTRDLHSDYFASLAAHAEPELTGPNQAEWFSRLDADHANLLSALDHLEEAASSRALLEFTVRLTRFWYVRGYLAEARLRLERALDLSGEVPPPLRRRALTAAASISLLQGDYAAATRFAENSLATARLTGEDRLVANGLSNLGAIVLAGGDTERSGELLESAVALARTVDDSRILALALNNLADHALTIGEYDRAEPLFAESLELLRARGDTANVARSLFNLGAVALRLGNLDAAELRLNESLSEASAAGDKEDLCWAFLGLAGLAAMRDDGERAALLLGAATALLGSMGAAFKPFERGLHDDTAERVRGLLGDPEYEQARARGTSLSVDKALELATSG